jgi:hypothetical protein
MTVSQTLKDARMNNVIELHARGMLNRRSRCPKPASPPALQEHGRTIPLAAVKCSGVCGPGAAGAAPFVRGNSFRKVISDLFL